MQKKSPIKQNILIFLDFKGLSRYEFYQITGITRGILDQNNGISEYNIAKFLAYYTEINPEWLLTGRGSMVRQPVVSGRECAEKMAIVKEKMQEREEVISLQRHRIKSLEQEVQQLTAENQKLKKESLSASHSKPMAPK